ncbi:hypothetical protein SH203_00034 [Brevundimonas sp. SH203]|uniref:hypothetical protein n=1 Tax=Brevundimonas sp. SH203 TaxID=345167 RepID=UPI0009D4FCD7|nr:hypothetical protein [Brevundimonas sp. SH203]GAW39659.1 hypothetical protein SH203_00034 [Brevundimonas sp. SH203]
MTLDDETLMRWADGELSPEHVARLEAAARTDPALAERMAAARRLRAATRQAFPALVDPRDRDLARLIAGDAHARATPLSTLTTWLTDALTPRHAPVWAGLAATAFVVGVLIGPRLNDGPGVRIAEDGALADAGLVKVLDRRLASQGADSAGRAVGLTFQDGEGRWCRTFQARNDGLAGLACLRSDGWTVQALAPLSSPQGEVRTASSDTPAAVLAAIDALIAGPSADTAAETQARDAGWR